MKYKRNEIEMKFIDNTNENSDVRKHDARKRNKKRGKLKVR